ncbi:unnamed protein product [Amoebophrya sp. A120]|nr:unnamed protein product [Amoebophrya sp. A120]CAD7940798.1 unnamed protein product [Amoebophrya sp. A120]|eukprot:GSA120T00002557001.1
MGLEHWRPKLYQPSDDTGKGREIARAGLQCGAGAPASRCADGRLPNLPTTHVPRSNVMAPVAASGACHQAGSGFPTGRRAPAVFLPKGLRTGSAQIVRTKWPRFWLRVALRLTTAAVPPYPDPARCRFARPTEHAHALRPLGTGAGRALISSGWRLFEHAAALAHSATT